MIVIELIKDKSGNYGMLSDDSDESSFVCLNEDSDHGVIFVHSQILYLKRNEDIIPLLRDIHKWQLFTKKGGMTELIEHIENISGPIGNT